MQEVFHGSYTKGLKKLNPVEAGHGEKYVYAVSDIAFALIFTAKPRSTLVAKWGRYNGGLPYFCELREGIFNEFYKGKSASVYVLDGKNFSTLENGWEEEIVSQSDEIPLREVVINDVAKYLMELHKEEKFKFISYKYRKEHFPHADERVIDMAKGLINKYGVERSRKGLKRWRPDLLYLLENAE